ncbi:MAG: hypothetical protein IPJ89_02300 [Candidatus Iainarchaeum archaeon]|uniref:Uncharacterized protein n=1 Tax=Candidatus Iainarchaeum sp. TaxID=3101447 RepID=A0A7T9I242_9ARCH|nr:MAG: hypothetical protein IPJ89_02300 [Candidatus Diapherotrites archaeon]
MRSAMGKNPHLVIVWLLAILFFFAWSGIAQEILDQDRVVSSPEFVIISPLNGDTISGELIAIVQPMEPKTITSATILSEELGFKESFPTDTWTAVWDTTAASNGKYELKVELCNPSACVDQKVDVVIENKEEKPVEVPPTSGGNGNGSTDPVNPDPQTKPASTIPAPRAVELFPSDRAGAFYLRDPVTGEDVDKSDGESWKVEPGTYALHASFFSSFIASIEIQKMRVENDGVAISLEEETIREPFEFDGEKWLPVASVEIRFGFPSSAEITLRPDSDLSQFWCLGVEPNTGRCTRLERIGGVSDDRPVRVDAADATIVRARRIPTDTGAQPEGFQVLATNREHRAEWISLQDTLSDRQSDGAAVQLGRGRYDVRIKIPDFPIQFVSAEGVRVDGNGTFIAFTSFPGGRAEEGIVVQLESGFAFEKGFFSISPDYNSQRTQVCRQWNGLLNWCLGEWIPTQETTLAKGTQVYRFFPPNTGETIRMEKSKAQKLLRSISLLKQLYGNRRYFEADFAREQFPVLDELFGGIEISMECANPIAASDIVVKPITPVKPVDSIPAPADTDPGAAADNDVVGDPGTASETIPAETVVPAGEQDTNAEQLSFQADEAGELIPIESDESSPAEEITTTVDPIVASPPAEELPSRPENPDFQAPIEEESIPLDAIDSAWEKRLPSQDAFEQNENLIQCDGVQLQNHFDDLTTPPNTADEFFLGGSIGKAKQTMVLTNETDSPQRRIVAIRLRARDQGIRTDEGVVATTPLYAHIDSHTRVEPVRITLDESGAVLDAEQSVRVNEQIDFLDQSGERMGVYNWSDFVDAGVAPTTLVHRNSGDTIIDTLITVDLQPFETRIIDPTYDLATATSYSVAWTGSASNDAIGQTNDSNEGIYLIDSDNNGYANDLIIVAPAADINGRADVGGIYLIKDVNTFSGTNGLNPNTYSARWYAGILADAIGRTGTGASGSGKGVQFFDLDGNGYVNDMLITASNADVAGASATGAVWLVKDIDKKIGDFNLNKTTDFSAGWDGGSAGDALGHTFSSQGIFVVNIDNNAQANDMIVASSICNSGGTDNGCVYLIKDIHTKVGQLDLASASNYAVRFDGNGVASNDNLGSYNANQQAIEVVNTDGNAWANDILIGSSNTNTAKNGGTDGGAIYLIKDIHTKIGTFRFNVTTTYDMVAMGASTWQIGFTNGSGPGHLLFDMNGDGVTNDLLFVGSNADINNPKTNNGVICLLTDINSRSGAYDSNTFAAGQRFNACWNGAYASDLLGQGIAANTVGGLRNGYFKIANLDGNAGPNDLLLGVPNADYNGKNGSGAVYLIRDINTFSGVNDLNIPASYSVIWRGGATLDALPLARNHLGDSMILANLDNNASANDLIISTSNADINGKTNSGAVYIILDINTIPNGDYYLGHDRHYFSRYNGGANEFLSDTNGTPGVILADTDNNGWANDLLIASPNADLNNKRDNGAVYYIRDVHLKPGRTDLNTTDTNRYNIKWYGGIPLSKLGDTNLSAAGMQLVNVDNNAYANDLILFSGFASNAVVRAGNAILLQNIDSIPNGNYDFNQGTNYVSLWNGGAANDTLGDNNRGSGKAFVLGDVDGNGYTNDIIFSVPFADLNSLTNNGGVYLIKDIAISNPYTAVKPPTLNAADYNWLWDGDQNYDEIGGTSTNNFPSTFMTNVDDGTTDNDLIIVDSLADVNGKTDAGAVYLVRNVGSYTEGPHWLGYINDYTAMWSGATAGERLGSTFNPATGLSGGPGVLVIDSDANTYANDLLIAAPGSYTNGNGRGVIYYIKNVDTATGDTDLNHANHSTMSLVGVSDGDALTYTANSAIGMQVVDVDGSGGTNDLVVAAPTCDCSGLTDNGGVYLIKDFNTLTGRNTISSVRSADWYGGSNSDLIGHTNSQGVYSVQLVDIDGNGYNNDMILSGFGADINGKADAGVTYLIRDINVFSGSQNLSSASSYYSSYNGGEGWYLSYAGLGVQLVNVDGNEVANDLLIISGSADVNGFTDNGNIVLIKDAVNRNGAFDLNNGMASNFSAMWMGGSASDNLGVNFHFLHSFNNTPGMQPLVLVTNLDGNYSANDMVIQAGLADANGFTNTGSIYTVLDINVASGYYSLANPTSFNMRLNGDNGQLIGMSNNANTGIRIVNVDNNQYANDLLIVSPAASTFGRTINGSIYLIKDVQRRKGEFGIVDPNNYDVSWSGIGTFDLLGDNNNSGNPIQVVDLDNNGWANDLVMAVSFADVVRVNNGGIVFIKDIETKSGQLDLLDPTTYSFAYYGGSNNDEVGSTTQNQLGVQLVSLDNNSYANDLILTVPLGDANGLTDNGIVYVITNIENTIGALDLDTSTTYTYRFIGATSNDRIGDTNHSGIGVNVVNMDGDEYANDLMIIAPQGDLNGFANNGIIYFKRNLLTDNFTPNLTFTLSLPSLSCSADLGNGDGADGPCTRAWIESTDTSGVADQNAVAPDGQSTTIPFFVYDNQSTTQSDINIYLDLNVALPSTLRLKTSQYSDNWRPTCLQDTRNHCLSVSTTSVSVGRAHYTAGAQDLNLYFWGDFIGQSLNTRVDRNVDSNAVDPV